MGDDEAEGRGLAAGAGGVDARCSNGPVHGAAVGDRLLVEAQGWDEAMGCPGVGFIRGGGRAAARW